jgi:hypothetical protein
MKLQLEEGASDAPVTYMPDGSGARDASSDDIES